jgi:hypothetical protein
MDAVRLWGREANPSLIRQVSSGVLLPKTLRVLVLEREELECCLSAENHHVKSWEQTLAEFQDKDETS